MDSRILPLLAHTFSLLTFLWMGGCSDQLSRLKSLKEPPPLYPIVNPAERAKNIEPPQINLPTLTPPPHQNSLWQTGGKAFLKDQRASTVGDIVKIRVDMKDQGKFENLTQIDRQSTHHVGIPHLGGFETKIAALLPKGANPATLIDLKNNTQYKGGQGSIERSENLQLTIPALVTQILPNGYFMIQGSQEIHLGEEVRRIMIQGILRPEDIDIKNTAPYERLTEARIFYGGEGDLNDMQKPRYGTKALDILSPF